MLSLLVMKYCQFMKYMLIAYFLVISSESKFVSNRGKSKHNVNNNGKGPLKGIDAEDISINHFKPKGKKEAGKATDGNDVKKQKFNQYFRGIPIYGASVVIEFEESDTDESNGFVDFGVYYEKKELNHYITNTNSNLNDNKIRDIISNDLSNEWHDEFKYECNEWIYIFEEIPY
eukprot:159848_1